MERHWDYHPQTAYLTRGSAGVRRPAERQCVHRSSASPRLRRGFSQYLPSSPRSPFPIITMPITAGFAIVFKARRRDPFRHARHPGVAPGKIRRCFPPPVSPTSLSPTCQMCILTSSTIPARGTGAKRRSYCCIVDYLTPVMHHADSYEELAKLDVSIKVVLCR
jgi:hypothetical protein